MDRRQQLRLDFQATANDYLADVCSCLFEETIKKTDRSTELVKYINVTSGKRPPIKSAIRTDVCQIPVYGASSLMGFTSDALTKEKLLVIGRVGTLGVVQRIGGEAWPSDNTLVISTDFYETAFQLLRRVDYLSLNRGSTQPLITQRDLKGCEVPFLTKEALAAFEQTASKVMALYDHNVEENKHLASMRDALLPKLMSGEIDVSQVKLPTQLNNHLHIVTSEDSAPMVNGRSRYMPSVRIGLDMDSEQNGTHNREHLGER